MSFFTPLFLTLLTLLVVPKYQVLADNPNGHFAPTNPNFKVTPTGKNSCAIDAIWAQLPPEKEVAFKRPLAKLAYAEEFIGATELRTGV
ncbi:MAG: hypothetical protein K2X94_04625 [Amoebophilaceae bacterium]|nr:hypothetical protein [Amoebophilaceae bacterium]